MFKWLLSKWRARQRQIDIMILWPRCKQQAIEMGKEPPLDWAKVAFMVHAKMDPAWVDEFSEDEIEDIIDGLT